MAKVTTVIASDWQGMYIDGKKVHEDHRLRVDEVLNSLVGKKITETNSIELTPRQEGWLNEIGNLPDKLEDIPKDQ